MPLGASTQAFALGFILNLALSFPVAGADSLHRSFSFDIAPEPLAQALRTYGQVSGQAIIFTDDLVEGMTSPPLKGLYTPEAALARLLKGTGLTTERSPSGAIMIRRAAPVSPFDPPLPNPKDRRDAVATTRTDSVGEIASSEVDEIIVTAQKRTERFIDVPLSLSVIPENRLARSQANNLQDLVSLVPGLQLIAMSPISNQLAIRGVSIGAGAINSSVATYIDETPYTSQGPFAGSATISPNLDSYDIARIEVLRGPQGTLYGANALAGLLKYVTNAPDPLAYSASALVGGSTVAHGGAGYELHGMLNLPLSDVAAFRLVVGDTHFPGYIDDPGRGKTDINSTDRTTVRGSFLWQPSQDFSVRLNALYQHVQADDSGAVDLRAADLQPLFGDLEQERAIDQVQSMRNVLFNATIRWDAELATLVSSSSFSRANLKVLADATLSEEPTLQDLFGGNYGAVVPVSLPLHSFMQEFRLSSPSTQPFQWLIGTYFNDEFADEHEPLYPLDLDSGVILTNFEPALGAYHITSKYREYAGFGSVTLEVAPALEIGLGGRYSQNKQQYHQVSEGLFTGSTDFVTPSSQHVFTYSADLKYQPSSNAMVYARVATGFVPGGPNDVVPGSALPSSFRSSGTTNFEFGVKGTTAAAHLAWDMDAFQVNWHDIQLQAVFGNLAGITNGGEARSRGLEGSLRYTPWRKLELGLSGAYTDARLTSDAPTSVGGTAGDRLPQSPRFAATLNADYEWPLWESLSGFGGIDWHYQTNRLSEFSATTDRVVLPGYSIVNLHAGMKRHSYVFTMYVKNLADARAISALVPETIRGVSADSAYLLPPRTVGVTLAAQF
jgi:iron complex outermembrane recepter protein